MTNDELWDQEIENLRERVLNLVREIRNADDVTRVNSLAISLSAKLSDARKGRFERLDYLTWKLAYE